FGLVQSRIGCLDVQSRLVSGYRHEVGSAGSVDPLRDAGERVPYPFNRGGAKPLHPATFDFLDKRWPRLLCGPAAGLRPDEPLVARCLPAARSTQDVDIPPT